MTRHKQLESGEQQGRRDFLKTSLAAAGAAAVGSLPLARSAHAAGSDVIRVGLIGCGNRGPGAAVNALSMDPGARLVAMGDVFIDQVKSRREILKKEKPEQVQVDDAHCFSGLDSYKHVIESSDVVLIACASKFHPMYAEAAVKAARVIGLEVAGVDMLEAKTGPKIMEVNSSPGFEGLEAASGVDIAALYVEHAVGFARAHATGSPRARLI